MKSLLHPRLGNVFLLGSLLLAGCASDTERRPVHPSKPPPPLAGDVAFFDDRLLVELRVGAGIGGEFHGEGAAHPRGGPGGGRMSFGGGVGGMRAGGHRGGEGGERGAGPREEAAERPTGPGGTASTLPPVMIHLRVTNRSPEHLNVAIIDFLSPLGNFVINPEKLSLDPDQTVEVEPMTSRLDNALDSADVTLALHLPGKTERKTVTLHVAPLPGGAPPEGTRPPQ